MSTEIAVLDEGIANALTPQLEALGIDKKTVLREMSFAAQILSGNDFLRKMPAESIIHSILNAVQCGLTLSPIAKEAYLVPRKGKCYLDPSYVGLAKTITDTGAAKHNNCQVVYANDDYLIDLATEKKVMRHTPAYCIGKQRGKPICCYSIFTLADGSFHIEIAPIEGPDGIYETARRRSESYKKYLSKVAQEPYATCVWITDEEQMIRKSTIKRHVSKMPRTGGDWSKVDLLVATDNIDYSLEAGQGEISQINTLIQCVDVLISVTGDHPDYSPEMNKVQDRLAVGVSSSDAVEIADFLKGIISSHNEKQFALTNYEWGGIYLRDTQAIRLIRPNIYGGVVAIHLNEDGEDTKRKAAVTMQELYDSSQEDETEEESGDAVQQKIDI